MSPSRLWSKDAEFQSTLPVRGATWHSDISLKRRTISIHAPRAGSDLRWRAGCGWHDHFNPRSPCGERPKILRALKASIRDFNPRSPCGERLDYYWPEFANIGISIHAPRAGSDVRLTRPRFPADEISIHAPRAGSDHAHTSRRPLPAISIHAPRAGSDLRGCRHHLPLCISIHAPRAGSDLRAVDLMQVYQEFQSTLPVRGATAKMPKTEPFILSNFHNFKKYTDRTRTKVIIKMELWINLSPFSGANRTGNLWSLLLRTLKGS